MGKPKRLVLIEWEDSAMHEARWIFASDAKPGVSRIASVGWLLRDGKKVKLLAASVGGLDGKVMPQVSGMISIPTRCILSVHNLEEKYNREE